MQSIHVRPPEVEDRNSRTPEGQPHQGRERRRLGAHVGRTQRQFLVLANDEQCQGRQCAGELQQGPERHTQSLAQNTHLRPWQGGEPPRPIDRADGLLQEYFVDPHSSVRAAEMRTLTARCAGTYPRAPTCLFTAREAQPSSPQPQHEAAEASPVPHAVEATTTT